MSGHETENLSKGRFQLNLCLIERYFEPAFSNHLQTFYKEVFLSLNRGTHLNYEEYNIKKFLKAYRVLSDENKRSITNFVRNSCSSLNYDREDINFAKEQIQFIAGKLCTQLGNLITNFDHSYTKLNIYHVLTGSLFSGLRVGTPIEGDVCLVFPNFLQVSDMFKSNIIDDICFLCDNVLDIPYQDFQTSQTAVGVCCTWQSLNSVTGRMVNVSLDLVPVFDGNSGRFRQSIDADKFCSLTDISGLIE